MTARLAATLRAGFALALASLAVAPAHAQAAQRSTISAGQGGPCPVWVGCDLSYAIHPGLIDGFGVMDLGAVVVAAVFGVGDDPGVPDRESKEKESAKEPRGGKPDATPKPNDGPSSNPRPNEHAGAQQDPIPEPKPKQEAEALADPAPKPKGTPKSKKAPSPPAPAKDHGADARPAGGSETPAPRLGKTVIIAPSSGDVVFRAPHTDRFVALDGSEPVPTGSVIDARRGTVALQSALDASGHSQTGHFHGAVFRVRQRRDGLGMTELRLVGRELDRCPGAHRLGRSLANASARRRSARGPKRRLWASDQGGRFRTRGANSVATARGTAWLTEDRCDGTLTRVTEGSVEVRAHGRRVLVHAGQQRLVAARRPSRGR